MASQDDAKNNSDGPQHLESTPQASPLLPILALLYILSFIDRSNKYRRRWIFIFITFGIVMLGFTAMLAISRPALPGLLYFFLFFTTAELYPSITGCISWIGNNIAPAFKRAIGMAVLMTVGNLGGGGRR
ncbi:hypothetical protein BDV12DRAFT_200731 [Aspergillus spectabilis]